MNEWTERLLNALIRGLVAVLTGGGLLTASEWSWFGTVVFTNFASTLEITFQNHKLIQHEVWNAGLLFDSLDLAPGPGAFLGLIGLVLLLAHVLFKKTRQGLQQGHAATPQQVTGWLHRQSRTLAAIYVRYFYVLTAAVFLALVCCLWLSSSVVALVILFLLVSVPGTLYLLCYSKDLIHGSYAERFVYVVIILCFFLALFGLPRQYGHHRFDPIVWQVVDMEGTEKEDLQFAFEDLDGLLATLKCPPGGGWTIVLSEATEDFDPDPQPASLRDWKENIKPCLPDVAVPAFDDLEGLLRGTS